MVSMNHSVVGCVLAAMMSMSGLPVCAQALVNINAGNGGAFSVGLGTSAVNNVAGLPALIQAGGGAGGTASAGATGNLSTISAPTVPIAGIVHGAVNAIGTIPGSVGAPLNPSTLLATVNNARSRVESTAGSFCLVECRCPLQPIGSIVPSPGVAGTIGSIARRATARVGRFTERIRNLATGVQNNVSNLGEAGGAAGVVSNARGVVSGTAEGVVDAASAIGAGGEGAGVVSSARGVVSGTTEGGVDAASNIGAAGGVANAAAGLANAVSASVRKTAGFEAGPNSVVTDSSAAVTSDGSDSGLIVVDSNPDNTVVQRVVTPEFTGTSSAFAHMSSL